jgi:peptide/nickel transport system permease protein
VQYARLVRGSVLTLREREFILSARAIGVRDWRIIVQHLLPNLIGPVIVLMTLNVATNILLESSLTFLGLGVDPTIRAGAACWRMAARTCRPPGGSASSPALPSSSPSSASILLGDWLRDSLDPTGRSSR